MSVAPSSLGTQPIGSIERVFEDVYQLKLPVPFPLRFVSSYLVSGEEGWTVIDPGFDYPEARDVWELRAPEVGLDLDGGIEKVVVTHLHPDHIGLAKWMQDRSASPVFMLEKEIENAKIIWNPKRDGEEFVRFLLRNGMPENTARPTVSATTTDLGVRVPDDVTPVQPGDTVTVGDGRFRVVHTPGHSDHHFMLHDPRRKVLVAGDHLLLKITPNIGLWPYTKPRPLERYMDCLEDLRILDADTVLPGHGPIFHDMEGRIDELLAHHEERLDAMHASFDGRPETAFEISRRVFPNGLSPHQLRFALAETLAHLEFLADTGRAERIEGEIVRFRAV